MTDFFKHLLEEFKIPLENYVLIFSLILFIILLSPIILRKINIPSIIGLILSGVLIGPYGLGVLEKSSAIDLFSTIGLLYIMFIAGLELDLNEFKTHRNKSLLFGLFTFLIPISIGYPVCRYVLGYDFDASFLTASMFATHTLVTYPIVSKLGVSKNQAVAVTVGGTILTDTAVLIILAVIIGKNQGSLTNQFWITLAVSLTIFSIIMFAIVPRVAKWFFQKLESEKHSHYIFVLSVVFFAAFLAEVAGVEPIIGAFMAGLALNKLIPHSSALMNRIEFIGNSLFIPFFLISVGMLVDVKVIFSGHMAILVALTLSASAIMGKWLAAFITQKVFRYSVAQRQLIFGLSNAHAAATLAVILVGFRAGVLDENILNGTIILILITCIVASFATEKAAKKIIVETQDAVDENLDTSWMHNELILLPTANINNIEKLLEFTVYIKDKKSPNPISILTVVSNNDEAELNLIRARKELEESVKLASSYEAKVNVVTTIDHNVASGITRVSRELMADIIILGWPQHTGFFDKLMGEKLQTILSNTDKTTFICDIKNPSVYHKRILVAIPPLGEFENGFELWFMKLSQLSQELSISMLIFCNSATQKAVQKLIKTAKLSSVVNFKEFNDWEDFLILSRYVHEDDLIVLASARKGSASHMNILDNLPAKLDKHFPENSKIVIYPQQYSNGYQLESYEDLTTTEPLSKGIETIQKLGKGIGNIFKKD